MKTFVTLILTGFALVCTAQVKLTTVKQLEQRLAMGKDTTFVVNFWATWCGPCVEELPYFEQLNKDVAGKKVKVLLVSLDFSSRLAAAVKPFVKKMNLKSTVLLLNETKQQVYIDQIDPGWSGAIPATLFVNTEKKKRKFYENAFTYSELVATLASFNQ